MKNLHLASGLFLIPFLMALGAAAGADAAQARGGTAASLSSALDGAWAASYEKDFNKTTRIHAPSRTAWALLNYVFFREGSNGVLVGRDGWLFTREEFDYHPYQAENVEKNLAFIAKTQKRLAERDIKLLVTLVPAKARVYRAYLGRYAFPSYREGVYDQAARWLRASGIPLADPLPAMTRQAGQKPLFFKTDTHWTPEGAHIAAATAARRARAAWPDLDLAPAGFRTVDLGTDRHEGDLLRYIPLGPLSGEMGLKPESLRRVRTEKEEYATAASRLFADDPLPVALVGTSYSANPDWNFDGYLQEALRAGILNAAKEGLGPFETMKAYLSSPALSENPPRLVVWEIPERYLTVPCDL